ncbi:hypothetical protein AWB81_00949 [Caballeronia arationis]|jgi:hypothetical protein|uniref:hypothetical protein n=1 Tax=Caballeronia arationis TaxID=1777142 RepID=UPI00074D05C4|nr:hypothetical protein [Caballeronia arationis]SAK51550.1 hypothetical protein AWB81_00949 [Caballeronia arationis]
MSLNEPGTKFNCSDSKVIIFTFAGREAYLEIQKSYILKLLETHDNVEYHIWNFSRNERDNAYLQKLAKTSPKIRIFNEFYEGDNKVTTCVKKVGVICACVKCRVGKWSEPYKYYARNAEHKNDVFIKVDDDVVFIDTDRFPSFVDVVREHRGKILSAKVMNNGICSLTDQALRSQIEQLGIVRDKTSAEAWWYLCTDINFLRLSHNCFFENKERLLSESICVYPIPRTRFSINTIGFDWTVMNEIALKLGTGANMNDEHVISMNFDILIMQGFVTCHLHFSDQRAVLSNEEESILLGAYTEQKEEYLALAEV